MRQEIDKESIQELANSIKAVGLINPITLRKDTKGYEVIAGHRRLEAAKSLGWETIPAICYKLDDTQTEKTKIAENIIRKDVDPIDEGYYLSEVMKKLNLSQKELAQMIDRTESYVHDRLRATEYHPELKRAVRDGFMSFSVARELNKLVDEDQLLVCINTALEYGTTPAQARIWVQNYKAQHIAQEATGPFTDLSPDESLLAHSKLLQTCQSCGVAKEPKDLLYLTLCRECNTAIKGALTKG